MQVETGVVKGNRMGRHEAFSLEFLEPSVVVRDGPVFTYATQEQPWFRRTLIRAVERVSGRARFERIYRRWQAKPRDETQTVFTSAVLELGIKADVTAADLARIPATGPLLVVANHPYGIVDGLLIGHLISTRRVDVKLICHALLCQPVEARDVLLPIDFGAGPEARRTSAETRRRAVEWLDQGHALIIFPAGGVATAPRPWRGRAADFGWHPFVARLARRAGVQTLAIFVGGQNSRLFQLVSHLSYPLRVALIFHETRRVLQRRIKVTIAEPLGLGGADPKTDLVADLRARTYAMAGCDGPRAADVFEFPARIVC
ncbi:MAG: lysophospholipid acyltransferase family protein [bacterium]